MSNKVKMRAV